MMKTFINDYTEPVFERATPLNCRVKRVENTNKNCTIIEPILQIKKETAPLNRKMKFLRKIAEIKKDVKTFLNLPKRTQLIKCSDKNADQLILHEERPAKKSLTKSIATEIRVFDNKRIISVKTDIRRKYLNPIPKPTK